MNSFTFFHWYPLFLPTHQVTMNTEDVCLSGCGQHFARPDPGMFKVDHRLYELSRQMKRFHSFLSHDWSTSRWMKLMSLGTMGKGIGLERVIFLNLEPADITVLVVERASRSKVSIVSTISILWYLRFPRFLCFPWFLWFLWSLWSLGSLGSLRSPRLSQFPWFLRFSMV